MCGKYQPHRRPHSRERGHSKGGKHDGFSSHVPPSTITSQRKDWWRNYLFVAWRKPTQAVPKPVILPSMRSEGPQPTGDLVLDAETRREIEQQLEEKLRASSIGTSWADEDDDLDLTKDPFQDRIDINSANTATNTTISSGDDIHPEKRSTDECAISPNPSRDTRIDHQPSNSDRQKSTVLDGSLPEDSVYDERTRKNRYEYRTNGSRSNRTKTHKSRNYGPSNKTLTPTTPDLITRCITIRLRADADPNVIPVRLPRRA